MKTFTMTQLTQETGLVADAVDREPAIITRHGRARYVMLRADEYQRLVARRQASGQATSETPTDIQALLADKLAALAPKPQ